MKTGTRVTLMSFNGKKISDDDTSLNEDYCKLIGLPGTIIDVPEERSHFEDSGPNARVCVRFDRDVCAMGLEAHNQVADSLWIWCGDLVEIDN